MQSRSLSIFDDRRAIVLHFINSDRIENSDNFSRKIFDHIFDRFNLINAILSKKFEIHELTQIYF